MFNALPSKAATVAQVSKPADLSRLGSGERDCRSVAQARPTGLRERERTDQSPIAKSANRTTACLSQVWKPAIPAARQRAPARRRRQTWKPALRGRVALLCFSWLLFFLAFTASAQTGAPPASYFRSYINDIPNEPLVTVTVTNAIGVSCFTIEEDLSPPAVPINITGSGVYLPGANAIRWGPFFHTTYTNVSYRLTGLPDTYPISGGSWMDGAWFFSPGVTMVPILPPNSLPVPTPPVFVVAPTFTITPAGTVPVFNGSFESPALPANTYQYYDTMTVTQQNYFGWVGSGNSPNGPALFSNNSGWNYLNATNGVQAVALPGTAAISQTINFPAAGTFMLNWWAADPTGQTNPAIVQVDGSTILSWQATNTVWEPFSTPFTLASGGLHTIAFAGTGAANVSVGLDNVSITGTNVPSSVTIFCGTPGASIYYTLNDGPPTNTSTPYIGAIYLTSLGVVWAEAFESPYLPSPSAVAVDGPAPAPANMQVARSIMNNTSPAPAVTFTIIPGTNASCETLTETLPAGLSAANVSANGNYIPGQNVVVWGPFIGTNQQTQQTLSYQPVGLPGTYGVQAAWSVDGVGGGETVSTNIVITGPTNLIAVPPPQVATPGFNPLSGGNVPVTITITDATPGAVIYYTVDGTLPTQNSTEYTAPFARSGASVVRAGAFESGWTPSTAAVAYYGPPAATANAQVSRSVNNSSPSSPVVTFTVTPGLGANCVAVVESLPSGLGAVNVSSGGNYIPAENAVVWGPFFGTSQQTLSYQAVGLPGSYPVQASWSVDGVSSNEALSASIVIAPGPAGTIPTPPLQTPTPVITPSVSESLPVTAAISDSDLQAQIYYTTDGSLPTQSSTPYTVPLTFGVKTSLRAVAYHTGYLPSVSALGEYVPVVTTNIVALAQSVTGSGSFLPTIYLNATPYCTNDCYAVIETIPFGLTPSGLSGDGIWDPSVSQIRWGPYLDNQPRVFSFNVAGASGNYILSGQTSFDGYSTNTTTAVQVNAQYIGRPPVDNLAACAQDFLTYNLDINPNPGVVTVTSASGTINWGDGTTSPITQPVMTFEKTYTASGTYSIVVSATWSGYSSSANFLMIPTSVTDMVQVVTTCEAPQIVSGPSNQVVLAGSTAQFGVSASSSVPMTFQWYFNSSAGYFSANNFATLSLPDVTLQQAGNYLVIITNAFGSVTSAPASLTVIAPVITSVMVSQKKVQMEFQGLPNVTTRVWETTNLLNPVWIPIYTNTTTALDGTWQFTDPNPYPDEYYRFSTP